MEVVTLTNPSAASIAPSILRGVREALTGVDEALLAVAFVQVAGVNFLDKQLKALTSSTRLVVTASFGMTNPAALAIASSIGTSIGARTDLGLQRRPNRDPLRGGIVTHWAT